MKIGFVQTAASSDLKSNLAKLHEQGQHCVSEGADLVVFAEMAYLSGRAEVWRAELGQFELLKSTFSKWAKDWKVNLIPGSVREPKGADRYFNTLFVFGRKGELLSSYRKIFLFQANLPHKTYNEAQYCEPGKTSVVVDIEGFRVGLGICFDLRFPEFFRALKKRGAEIMLLPAAFTVPTGEAHWEVLARARAIENQVYFIAPGLTGTNGEGNGNYGHSLAIGPWGNILTDLGEPEGWAVIETSKDELKSAESRVAAWSCRRDDLFPNS